MESLTIDDIRDASTYLKDKVLRSPLIKLDTDDDNNKIYLKLENLQPVGSFKLRGAMYAIGKLDSTKLKDGVYTSSAGNFAQGLAYGARYLDVPCQIIVPDTAPVTKIEGIKRLGGEVIKVPYNTWWSVMESYHFDGMSGHFIHPVCEKEVIAGNGTIGLEILEDLPDVDMIIGPFGGGGIVCGIAAAVKHYKPEVQILACELDIAAPLTSSRKAGHPLTLTDHKSSFVDGMGGKSVFKQMWPLTEKYIDDTVLVTLPEICEAVQMLVQRARIVAEGAGAAPLAAALKQRNEKFAGKNIVCIVSGGNIDTHVLSKILQGDVP